MSNLPYPSDPALILVVDDDKTTRILLRHAMEKEGYQVVEAQDGKECLACYEQLHPDIVLMDVQMPEMDGFICCTRLQELPGSDRTPVLMITGLEDPASVDKAFTAGATDYVTKPIHWPVLRQRVRRLIQASRAQEELRQRTRQEQLIATILERIRQSLNLNVILNTTVSEVRRFLGTDRAIVYQLQGGGSGFVAVESVNPDYPSILGQSISDPCFDRYIDPYRQGRILATEDIYKADLQPCHIKLLAQFQVRANLVVPIIHTVGAGTMPVPQRFPTTDLPGSDGLGWPDNTLPSEQPDEARHQLWGLLIAHQCSTSRRWLPTEIELVKRLATQVAIAIQQSQLYQQLAEANRELQRLATSDGLTGVANRRSFDEQLGLEWQRMAREQAPLSLILCDVDFFKPYNDTYGHQAGDHCLREVARVLRETVQRPADLVARYGGEEFAVILPNTDAAGALQVAQKIHAQVKSLQIPHTQSLVSQFITLSVGVASLVPKLGLSASQLITTADEALYQAKAEGRDRVLLHKV